MKKLMLLLCGLFLIQGYGQETVLTSPDKKITVSIPENKESGLTIALNGKILVSGIMTGLEIGKVGKLNLSSGKYKLQSGKGMDSFVATVPTKFGKVEMPYQEFVLKFRKFDIEFRIYDNGVAYRYVTNQRSDIEVIDEELSFEVNSEFSCYLPEEQSLISHFENYYTSTTPAEIPEGTLANLPFLFTDGEGVSVSVTESDVYDYPNLFLKKSVSGGFESHFPNHVLKMKDLPAGKDRLEEVEEAAPYIAATSGKRSFPWRIFMIASSDADLLTNNLVYQLASPLKIKDISWIKPGKVAWDWWNANNIYGVDFESGLNTETYKYYIDFASEYGLEYIILDEGWSKSTLNVMEPNPDIDVQELVNYGKGKNVGIILWSLWRPLDENMDALLTQYREWGVKGVKVDFIQRADQYVVNFYERLAKTAASYELLVDYHGAFKPSGMRKGYPNIINFEGVKGLENCKWEDKITPEHDLTIPFTRMTAGVMDYTPGAMDNASRTNFIDRFTRPMSMGTRAHQMAMYVVYEAPLQMLADSPSNYYKEPECTSFISRIPTTWTDTKVMDAKIGKHLLLARKHGDDWYVGGMNAGEGIQLSLDLSFLEENTGYTIEWIQDGVNSDKMAKDYTYSKQAVTRNSKLDVSMHRDGGWVAIISRN
ncbi:glycoside hydrolase family 97 protein [Robertkochia solimangrovi]|uniref:glycoside hydrolase family 97 protein n=1 Tax=Robertkochia solimangrovi TaxID=2213046 RepID=UPI001180CD24|nr:glycoside hydrolase family 97 protein [Robertkochia solimangrovi]TRZ43509.1 glycoside hydrolase family 97 protein [Robertkochia solimangrovi]